MTHEQIVYALLHTPPQMAFLQALLALAPLAAKLFNGASKARADARVQETQLNRQQDADAINRAVTDTELTQSKQNDAVQNALRSGIKDFSIARPDGVGPSRAMGGYRPSAITGINDLGKQFKDADLASIMAGTPKLTPPPKAGKFDKFLNIAGGIAGLVGLAGQAKNALNPDDAPDIDPSARVNTNMATPMSFTQSLNPESFAVPPPAQSTYRPKFTPYRPGF